MQQRHFRRIPFNAEVRLGSPPDIRTVDLLNLSLKGMLVRERQPSPPVDLGTMVAIEVVASPGLTLPLTGRLAHRQEDRLGFTFIDIDLETIGHLRRLIELNTGEAEQTLEELFRWGRS